jgi:hypothetical protein
LTEQLNQMRIYLICHIFMVLRAINAVAREIEGNLGFQLLKQALDKLRAAQVRYDNLAANPVLPKNSLRGLTLTNYKVKLSFLIGQSARDPASDESRGAQYYGAHATVRALIVIGMI